MNLERLTELNTSWCNDLADEDEKKLSKILDLSCKRLHLKFSAPDARSRCEALLEYADEFNEESHGRGFQSKTLRSKRQKISDELQTLLSHYINEVYT